MQAFLVKQARLIPLLAVLAISAPAVLRAEALPSPDALALQSRLLPDDSVTAFYAARDYAPLFLDPDHPGFAHALLAAFARAGEHGLPAEKYQAELLARTLAEASTPALRAEAEMRIAAAWLDYARDLGSGLLEPSDVDPELAFRPRREDPVALLARVVAARGDAAALIGELQPGHPRYAMLLAEKSRLESVLGAEEMAPPMSDGPVLRPGDSGPRVTEMRARLGAIGFSRGLGTLPAYDEGLAALIRLFQEQNGLEPDGHVGPRTVAALNQSDRGRLEQVLVNLERERWMNFPRGARHIQVNIAGFFAQVIDDGEVVFETRTVVGRADKHRTPEFHDMMTHMVVNPSWNVPYSIVSKEYLPQLQSNNNATNQQGIQIFYKGRLIDPTRVDFSRFNASNFPVTMRQPPGPGNALGKVKFLFPNQFDIYLHDTPAKRLFERVSRAFSHGCIRLQRPVELAELLLARQSSDPAALFANTHATGRETTINLDTPVPVYLTYHTVWTGADGKPVYFDDVYGRDSRVFAALAAAGVSTLRPEG
jgi:murein L,D-transpeptidase YcbB/YkuD